MDIAAFFTLRLPVATTLAMFALGKLANWPASAGKMWMPHFIPRSVWHAVVLAAVVGELASAVAVSATSVPSPDF